MDGISHFFLIPNFLFVVAVGAAREARARPQQAASARRAPGSQRPVFQRFDDAAFFAALEKGTSSSHNRSSNGQAPGLRSDLDVHSPPPRDLVAPVPSSDARAPASKATNRVLAYDLDAAAQDGPIAPEVPADARRESSTRGPRPRPAGRGAEQGCCQC